MYKNWLAAIALAAVSMSVGVSAASAEVWGGNIYVGGFVGTSTNGDTDWTYQSGGQTADHDLDGEVIGVVAGWSRQISGKIYGAVEIDHAGTGIEGSAPCPNPSFTCSSEINSITSLRAVGGYDITDQWAVYGTVGAAWADVTVATDNGGGPYADDQTVSGVVYGAGVQFQLSEDLTLRAEYLRYDLGEETFTVDNDLQVDAELNTDVLRVGVVFNF